MNKRISIIVPIYNTEKYLDKCITSILTQTYTDLEVILVDDGSTDSSGVICDRYAGQDSRVLVLHKENGGVNSARYEGIQRATGEYIGFVDGDDWIIGDMYETLYQFIENENVDMVSTGFFKVYTHLKKEESLLPRHDELPEGLYAGDPDMQYVYENMLLYANSTSEGMYPSLWSKLFHTKLVKELSAEMNRNLVYGEDLVFLHNYLLKCSSIYIKHTPKYFYRTSDNSAVHRQDDEFLMKVQMLYSELKKVYAKKSVPEKVIYKLEIYIVYLLSFGINQKMNFHKTIRIPWYILPFEKEIFEKKIVLYGAGEVGKDYYAQLCKKDQNQIVLWVDKSNEKYQCTGMDVAGLSKIKDVEYDWLIIAIKTKTSAEKIKAELEELGIPGEKILWKEPDRMIGY